MVKSTDKKCAVCGDPIESFVDSYNNPFPSSCLDSEMTIRKIEYYHVLWKPYNHAAQPSKSENFNSLYDKLNED